MLKGVVIGSAAALVVGAGLVAAAVAGRGAPAPAPTPGSASASPRMQIQLAAPKEPPAPASAPRLETVPPGAPDVRQPRPVRAAPPPVRPAERVETARDDDRWREPEPRAEDFVDEEEPPFLEPPPGGRYGEGRARWRDRPYDERRVDPYRPAPYEPEAPPGWWRR